MSRCKLDRMNIHLLLSADTLPLESERCWRLALAIYELVTNAVRHACFDGRDGEIKIKLMRSASGVNCRVTDNGSGLGRIKPGRGLRIVGELAKSMGGRMSHTFGTTSSSFVLDFPLTLREQHANRAVAARRTRAGRRSKATPSLPSASVVGEWAKPIASQPAYLNRRRHTMPAKLLSPCPRAGCSVPPSQHPMLHGRSSALLRVVRLCPGPPLGLGAGGPPPGGGP
jgi:Histidine kinase-like ATPase domain